MNLMSSTFYARVRV